MVEEQFSQTVRSGRSKLSVFGLLQYRCEACDTVMSSAIQFENNAAIIEAAEKKASCYVSIGMLKQFRERYSLSQRDAGRLVGAGDAAFGKYESGSKLSAPTAKLIRVALTVPGVVEMLAVEEGIALDGVRALEEDAMMAQVSELEVMARDWRRGRFSNVFHYGHRSTPTCGNDDDFSLEFIPKQESWHKQLVA